MSDKILTVGELILALQQAFPPNAEVWVKYITDFEPAHTLQDISGNDTYGLCIYEGKLVLIYDTFLEGATLLGEEGE